MSLSITDLSRIPFQIVQGCFLVHINGWLNANCADGKESEYLDLTLRAEDFSIYLIVYVIIQEETWFDISDGLLHLHSPQVAEARHVCSC